MDFSIIIPVRDRAEQIKSCVASCYRLDYPPTRYEVIVVDNGSTDETARGAQQAGARVISEPTPNRSLARNTGASVARGRWLAFTDSDCEVDSKWLAELAVAEERLKASGEWERTGAMAGIILSGEASSAVEAYITARRWLDQEKFLAADGGRFPFPWAATANLAIRAEVFKSVGGFDPEMPPAEDADWCWRAAMAGLKIHYAPAARVIHHHRADLKGMLDQARGYGMGNARLYAKHRAHWKNENRLRREQWLWALKGFLKTPYTFLTAGSSFERRFSWYDFLSNFAQARGQCLGERNPRLPAA